ncbi:hypothetical protein [Streptomyces sp. CB03238]|uniref:hypothetical protein n=1 Tax=Streptomyces sp. CB03238 TaxID=1907777 RepID=UPI0015C46311|nr:hypothetical protein [Streptomyces sp. CB03238]
MAELTRLLSRIRGELGDFGTSFRDVLSGTGELTDYDLSAVNVTLTRVSVLNGGTLTDLVVGTDYRVDGREGRVTLLGSRAPLPLGQVLIVEGAAAGMFTDEELTQHLRDAELQHCHNRHVTVRYRSKNGFIRYADEPLTLENLPDVEELPVVLLTVINALWAVATDASSDVNISTGEGTHVDRGQRYTQVLHQISVLTDRYEELCRQLNIGLFRIEMATLRRVSRTTGRYVPIYVDREFDDHAYPERVLPQIDKHDVDPSGIPNPTYPGWAA